ncbi:MAG: hypothetical protein ABIR83_07385 [Nakamurella sp.]
MNAVPRTRAFVAALGALVLLTVGACSSTDEGQASTSATSSTSSGSATGTGALADNVIPPATTDPSAPASSERITPNTELPSAPDPATTPVPAPNGGNVNETVPEVELTTNAAVPVSGTGDYGNGVTVRLAALNGMTTTAELPGEIAGPGAALTVRIVNSTVEAIDLGNVVVDLQDATAMPAIPMSTSPAAPFTGSLAAGATAEGVYVFTLPASYTGPATVSVTYTVDAPVVVFTGDIS